MPRTFNIGRGFPAYAVLYWSAVISGSAAMEADSSDTMPALTIQDAMPTTAAPGAKIRIVGMGFGGVPENLTVGVRLPDGWIVPMHVLGATETEIEAIVGPVPETAQPGRIVVSVGSGTSWIPQVRGTVPPRWVARPAMVESGPRSSGGSVGGGVESRSVDPRWAGVAGVTELLPLAFDDVSVAGPLSVWNGAGFLKAQAAGEFVARGEPVPPGERWYVGQLTAGALSVTIDGNWPVPAVVEIQARMESEAGDVLREVRVSRVVLGGVGAVAENAVRIADVIQAAFAKQWRLDVDCHVGDVTADSATLHLRLPGRLLVGGTLNVLVERPAVTLSAPRVFREAGTRFDRLAFRVGTVAGRRYRIQSNDGSGSAGWSDVLELEGVGGPMDVEDSAVGSAIRLYRVIEE